VLVVTRTVRGGDYHVGIAGEEVPVRVSPKNDGTVDYAALFSMFPSTSPNTTKVLLSIPYPRVNTSRNEIWKTIYTQISAPFIQQKVAFVAISSVSCMACYASGRTEAVLLDFTAEDEVCLCPILSGNSMIDMLLRVPIHLPTCSTEQLVSALHSAIMTTYRKLQDVPGLPVIKGWIPMLFKSIVFFGIQPSENAKIRAGLDSLLAALARDNLQCKLIVPPEAEISAWLGGSILGFLPTFEPIRYPYQDFVNLSSSVTKERESAQSSLIGMFDMYSNEDIEMLLTCTLNTAELSNAKYQRWQEWLAVEGNAPKDKDGYQIINTERYADQLEQERLIHKEQHELMMIQKKLELERKQGEIQEIERQRAEIESQRAELKKKQDELKRQQDAKKPQPTTQLPVQKNKKKSEGGCIVS